MTYKAYIQQDTEGCDYTIACARDLIHIEAESMDEARQELVKEIRKNYSYEDFRLHTAKLYEINQVFVVDLPKLYRDIDNEALAKARKESEEKEREEFERLRAKFGEQGGR